ncbi:MAG: hypothetical protein H5U17_15355 [Defluviimonas sp.]|nr:hypothetical protein [Defluviimonas sp.]
MASSYFSTSLALGAIGEVRSLATVSLARSLDEPVDPIGDLPYLSALLLSEDRPPRGVVRRVWQMNQAMPFAQFAPVTSLQHRILASGLRPGPLEQEVSVLHKSPSLTTPEWIDATLRTALSAPDFLRGAQMTAYRGLRRRVFFAPGGPALDPMSVTTFLFLILWCGRPTGFPPQAWARLEQQVTAGLTAQPGWEGPLDRLVLTEACKVLGREGWDSRDMVGAGADEGEKGIEDV